MTRPIPAAACAVMVAAALVMGCARPAPRRAPPRGAAPAATPSPAVWAAHGDDAAAAGGQREAAIHFEDLAGEPFPYPLVRARVRGAETWLVLDTGASHTVLDVWLLEQLGVELIASDQAGEGHAGEKVVTMEARAPHVELDGWGPIPGDTLAVRFPPLFRKLGLGGVLSPQSLPPPGMAVVVDLPANELRLVGREHALREGRVESLGVAHACVVGGEPAGVVYLVDGLVQGLPARLVVDSGAARSDLLAASAAGRRLRPHAARGEASYTVGGRVRGQRLDGAALVVGRVATTLDLGIMPGAPAGACPRDGHLGLDVLRHCVLVLARDHFGARCERSAGP